MRYCVIIITVILALQYSKHASANDIGLVLGYKSDSATANNTSVTVDTRTNLNFGMLSFFELGPQILLRMGFIYNPRNYGLTTGEVKLTYVDVPVGLMWKFSDYGGAFIGANAALNVSASCPAGACTNLNNVASGYQFGVNFKFAPHMGGAFYYEAMGSLVQNIENPKAVAIQFLYTFE